jgi:ribosomal protein L20
MARVKGGIIHKNKRKKVLKQAEGYFGSKHRLYHSAKEQIMHSLRYAYRDRRRKKRDFRKIWITRINAACRINNISYSKFIDGLTKAGVVVNRKMLSELAISNPQAFTELVNAAKEEDYYIRGVSGYRSYNYQDSLYNKYVTSDGKENADRYSARAGYSEHQTGLALDISNNKSTYMDFESTKEFEWMKNNAHKYGFILRYPKDKEKITGYMYEAWHYRFVGTEIATYIKKHNITYDEYYTMFIDL